MPDDVKKPDERKLNEQARALDKLAQLDRKYKGLDISSYRNYKTATRRNLYDFVSQYVDVGQFQDFNRGLEDKKTRERLFGFMSNYVDLGSDVDFNNYVEPSRTKYDIDMAAYDIEGKVSSGLTFGDYVKGAWKAITGGATSPQWGVSSAEHESIVNISEKVGLDYIESIPEGEQTKLWNNFTLGFTKGLIEGIEGFLAPESLKYITGIMAAPEGIAGMADVIFTGLMGYGTARELFEAVKTEDSQLRGQHLGIALISGLFTYKNVRRHSGQAKINSTRRDAMRFAFKKKFPHVPDSVIDDLVRATEMYGSEGMRIKLDESIAGYLGSHEAPVSNTALAVVKEMTWEQRAALREQRARSRSANPPAFRKIVTPEPVDIKPVSEPILLIKPEAPVNLPDAMERIKAAAATLKDIGDLTNEESAELTAMMSESDFVRSDYINNSFDPNPWNEKSMWRTIQEMMAMPKGYMKPQRLTSADRGSGITVGEALAGRLIKYDRDKYVPIAGAAKDKSVVIARYNRDVPQNVKEEDFLGLLHDADAPLILTQIATDYVRARYPHLGRRLVNDFAALILGRNVEVSAAASVNPFSAMGIFNFTKLEISGTEIDTNLFNIIYAPGASRNTTGDYGQYLVPFTFSNAVETVIHELYHSFDIPRRGIRKAIDDFDLPYEKRETEILAFKAGTKASLIAREMLDMRFEAVKDLVENVVGLSDLMFGNYGPLTEADLANVENAARSSLRSRQPSDFDTNYNRLKIVNTFKPIKEYSTVENKYADLFKKESATMQLSEFDSAYNNMRPKLSEAIDNYTTSGGKLSNFEDFMVEAVGESIRPFVRRLLVEKGLVTRTEPTKLGESAAAEVQGGKYVKRPEDITRVAAQLFSPEFLFRKNSDWLNLATPVIEAELRASHETYVIDGTYFDDILTKRVGRFSRQLSKDEQLSLRTKAEELFELRKKEPNKYLDLITNDDMYRRANMCITWFENMKDLIVSYKKDMYMLTNTSKYGTIYEQALKLFEHDSVKDLTKYKAKAADRLRSATGDRKLKADKIIDAVIEYKNLDSWGIRDFLTRIELGSYKVLDESGQVIAVRATRRLAQQAIVDLKHDDPKLATQNLTVADEFLEPVDPTKPRKGILKGEANIIEAMRAYSRIMRKKMNFDPVEAHMERAFREDKGYMIYPRNVRATLRDQMKWARGYYGMGDELADKLISRKLGTKPMLYTRSVAKVRSAVGYFKLGYRAIGGLVNFYGGHTHTFTKTGMQNIIEATQFLKTPEGIRLITENEWALGLDFAHSSTSGKLITKQNKLSPLYLFSWPEPQIRRVCLAANYLMCKKEGMSEVASLTMARRAVRFQAFTYNMASIPNILRNPTGKVIGQFKTYLSKEIEFLRTLSPREFGRYMTAQAILTGPRGLVLMLKSLPILSALGLFEELEEWINQLRIGNVDVSSGVPGALGYDVSGPGVFQVLHDTLIENSGAFLSDTIKLLRDVVFPAMRGDPEIALRAADWAANTVVAYKYMADFVQSVVTEDGWIREAPMLVKDKDGKIKVRSVGAKRYKVNSNFDKALLLAGIYPLEKAQVGSAVRMFNLEEQRNRDNYSIVIDAMVRNIEAGKPITEEQMNVAIGLGMTGTDALSDRIHMNNLPPREREVLKAKLLERARALDLIPEVE